MFRLYTHKHTVDTNTWKIAIRIRNADWIKKTYLNNRNQSKLTTNNLLGSSVPNQTYIR